MPHATGSRDAQEELDDVLIQQALDPENPIDFTRELEPGEKADDAVDFGDLSDDDLADDEDVNIDPPPRLVLTQQTTATGQISDPFLQDENGAGSDENGLQGDDFDDLFGEIPSSPVDTAKEGPKFHLNGIDTTENALANHERPHEQAGTPSPSSQLPSQVSRGALYKSATLPVAFGSKDPPLSREQQHQQALFAMSCCDFGTSETLPVPPENDDELLASLWPKFQRDTVPNFMDLLPPKRTRYARKPLLKPPRPVNPTKLNLDLAQDQEKSFKIPVETCKQIYDEGERVGIIAIQQETASEKSIEEDVGMESDYENDTFGGVSWQDLQVVCEDWDINNSIADAGSMEHEFAGNDYRSGNWSPDRDEHIEWPPAKRRKLCGSQVTLMRRSRLSFPSLHDPEHATGTIAKTIALDLNDSHLLIDYLQDIPAVRSNLDRFDRKVPGRGPFSKSFNQRYNISNDDAYDLLKENHQNKIRSTLGNPAVDHALPALRLQWPFYKTKLEKQEARLFHRPPLKINRHEQIVLDKPQIVKRRSMKGKDPQNMFPTSQSLSLGDNSSVLLLEYSEEYPTMMSNLGMGSKVINYYRRKTIDDDSRPKLDIGELAILLPQDKSPFSIFGHIDPGQVTPAIHNGMYRAPIFKQEAKNTDFLVVRSTTGVHGSKWFLRNIESLHAVGQEFPSVDVPGPHSRKVTTASKNRLKMISYRLIRKNKSHRINVSEVTNHFIDTTDMQNRQKMKEFMQFDKDHKEWKMRPGENVPDEDIVRTMVKPEDVCLLESMQVGQQHLQDAGFSKDDDESDDDDAKEGQSVEQQLAPWFTSRNFLHAMQGKAMLQLHGEGDPSGRGEAFSLIKTSMKGGFRAMGESVAEKLDTKRLKELGGHSYNVARQQQSYEESIRRIWEAQKQSLSSTLEQSDSDIDDDYTRDASDTAADAMTPRSETRTPATIRRRDDETASQSTRLSTKSQAGKILQITRKVRDKYGNIEVVKEIVRKPTVIHQYLKRRHAKEAESVLLSDIKPTEDEEANRRNRIRLEKELIRLQRNKDRRIARDKQKGIHTDGAADAPGSPNSPATAFTKNAGTQRKCANCGQVGHIKTNKKLCPMLNGTMKPEEVFSDSAFTTRAPAL